MGMTIDEEVRQIKEQLADVSIKYRAVQANYNARLKADMVAMLVRLENEIDDLRAYDDIETVDKCEEIIQQKINALQADGSEEV